MFPKPCARSGPWPTSLQQVVAWEQLFTSGCVGYGRRTWRVAGLGSIFSFNWRKDDTELMLLFVSTVFAAEGVMTSPVGTGM